VAQREIADSKQLLEQSLGKSVTLLAYPYGETNDSVDHYAREAGFEAAFATDRASPDHAQKPFSPAPRCVFPRNSAWEILSRSNGGTRGIRIGRGRQVMAEGRNDRITPHPSPLPHLFLWLPVLLCAALIFYLSSIPYLRFVEAWYDLIIRKIGHMGIFGVLARLLARAFSGSTYWPWKKIFVWSLVWAFLYACSDEYHQSFVPGRGASAADVAIDTLALGWHWALSLDALQTGGGGTPSRPYLFDAGRRQALVSHLGRNSLPGRGRRIMEDEID